MQLTHQLLLSKIETVACWGLQAQDDWGQGVTMAAVEIMFHREATDDRWMASAACKGLTNLFFPAPAERPQARDRREAMARTVCASCRVSSMCRLYARDNHEYGYWGGESEDERHGAGYRLIAPIGVRARGVG